MEMKTVAVKRWMGANLEVLKVACWLVFIGQLTPVNFALHLLIGKTDVIWNFFGKLDVNVSCR